MQMLSTMSGTYYVLDKCWYLFPYSMENRGRGCSFSEDTFKKIRTTYMESRKDQKSESGTNTKFKNQIVNRKNIESDILQMLVLFLAASFSMELLG